jgi:hypothetical protein
VSTIHRCRCLDEWNFGTHAHAGTGSRK